MNRALPDIGVGTFLYELFFSLASRLRVSVFQDDGRNPQGDRIYPKGGARRGRLDRERRGGKPDRKRRNRSMIENSEPVDVIGLTQDPKNTQKPPHGPDLGPGLDRSRGFEMHPERPH